MKKALALILTLALCLGAVSFASTAFATEAEYEYFYFGSYPQSKVEDTAITAELDKLAPDWENWTSYGYYSGSDSFNTMVQGDWMRYTDVTLNGEKYRGVKFTQYRPISTIRTSGESNSRQDENGYFINNAYWFKFEPLKWRILDKDAGLVMSEMLIDSQPYNNLIYVTTPPNYYIDESGQTFASNYAASSIRAWLNDDFYNTSFGEDEKTAISKKKINNSGYKTLLGETGYEEFDSIETEDNIFLLSYDEMINTEYGFNADTENKDSARQAVLTDYAKCQGAWTNENDTADWILRTSSENSVRVCCVWESGEIYKNFNDTSNVYRCVRPAMVVDLSYYDEPIEPTTEKTLADYILKVISAFLDSLINFIMNRK